MNFTDYSQTEIFTVLLSGVLMPWAMQLIKKGVALTGLTAQAVAAILALLGGVLVALLSGHWQGGNFMANSALIFSVANMIFRFLLSDDRLVDAPLAD